MEFKIFILFFTIICTSCKSQSLTNDEEKKDNFVLYDAMAFENKPNLESEGLKPIILLYENRLTKKDDSGKLILDFHKISKEAKQAAKTPEVIVSTDIERWNGDRSVSGEEMSNRFKELFDIFKQENPKVKIGNYGIAPSSLNIYRFYDKNKTKDSVLIEHWKKKNEKRFAALSHVDIIMPSLYIPEPDIKSWEQDFKTTIEEIRRHDKEKPIVVYLWPAYYDAPWSEYNRLIVDAGLWKSMLEIAYKYADSAIIWASKVDKDKNVIYWDDPKVQKIWRVTQNFIKEKGLK